MVPSKIVAALEALFFFALIECDIWYIRPRYGRLHLALLVVTGLTMFYSLLRWKGQHDGMREAFGIWPLRFGGWRIAAYCASCCIGIIVAVSSITGEFADANGARFALAALLYVPKAVGEWLVLSGYFGNTLCAATRNHTSAAIHAGMLFGIAHLPNPVLTPLAVLNGIVGVRLFLAYRTIWPLVIGHALIGAAVEIFLPHLSHNLRAGPGYWR